MNSRSWLSMHLVPVIALSVGLLSGCPSPADQRAMEGADALVACDLRGAHTAFDAAWTMDETRSDLALAYALTDLGLLVEDPAITDLAPRFGFDGPIDAAMLWGEEGLLHRMSRGDSCESVESWFRSTFPHPSAREGGPALTSTFDDTLTIGDARDALVALRPRFLRVARALELAAANAGEGVTIEGGCGLASTPTRVQAPELYVLAAALRAVAAVTEMLQSYDGELPLSFIWGSSYDRETEWVAAMNAHFLRVVETDSAAASRAGLRDAVTTLLLGVDAARVARSAPRVSDAVVDWTALPARVIDDTEAFADAAQAGLATDGMHAIPRVSPALSIDLGSFFTSPIDFTSEGPVWSVVPDDVGGGYTVADEDVVRALLRPRLSEDVLAIGSRWTFDVDWSGIEWSAFFDPGERWSSSYACE